MKFNIAVLPGDGIGPEIINSTVQVLTAVGDKAGHEFTYQYQDIGGASIEKHGVALTEQALKTCKKCDAVLLGAVGDPRWDNPLARVRPEDGLLALRKHLGLFANLRPVKVFPMLIDSTPFKPDILRGVDMVVVRELTGGLYFGRPKRQWRTSRGRRAVDTMSYSESEIERIVRSGFELARGRRRKLTSVDKANVLESSRLWRQVAIEVSADFPDIELDHQFVDACSMRLIQRPSDFDVIVTENTFGDILTDEASMLAGSLGMLPSASVAGIPREGTMTFGLYEPVHGSSPRRAGLDMANPIATILSAAMMLQYSLALPAEARAIEEAIQDVLAEGYRTYDIMSDGSTKVGTGEMGKLIARKIAV